MGGLSCVAGKPEEDPEPVETRASPKEEERRESQLPWNRQSLQVYCGDPKKTPESSEDKPPDEVISSADKLLSDDTGIPLTPEVTEETKQKLTKQKSTPPNGVVVGTGEAAENAEKVENNENSVEKADTSESSESETSEKSAMEDVVESESFDHVPEITVDPPHKFYSLVIENVDTSKVIKRPRSFDSADHYRIPRSRPMSCSPAWFKTKHPRSLHCITTALETEKFPPLNRRQRPQSMDFTGLLETKPLDLNSQKLKRMLTSPKKQRKHKESSKTDLKVNLDGFAENTLRILLVLVTVLKNERLQ